MSATEVPAFLRNKLFPKNLNVIADPDVLVGLSFDASGKKGATPVGLTYPTSVEDLQQLVKWASDHRVPLIPISSGDGNRQKGDTISYTPSLIVNLSKMKRILSVIGQDAMAIIEAGVTFSELDDPLAAEGLRSFRPLFVRASKSVMTSVLDRAPVTVPGKHWDAGDPMGVLEFVFGNGSLFRTGMAGMPGSLEKKLELGNSMTYGMGPAHLDFGRVLQGAQGALGIMTWGSMHTGRIPHVEKPYFLSAQSLDDLNTVVYKALRRRYEGQLFIVNAAQFKLMFGIDEASASADLVPPWIAYVELSSHDYFPDQKMAFQTKYLKHDADDNRVEMIEELAGVSADEMAKKQAQYEFESSACDFQGESQDVFCLSQLNRMPDHLAALNAKGLEDAAIYLQPLNQGVSAHCQFTYLEGRTAGRSVQAASVEAAECLAKTNGFFSRPCHPWAHVPFDRDRNIIPMIAKTKALMDPAGILNPGAQSLGGSL